MKKLTFSAFCFILLSASARGAKEPTLYWSMDFGNVVETTIRPDGNTDDKWKGDLSRLKEGDYFVHGRNRNSQALKVDNQVELSDALSGSECIRNPSSCSKGLTIGFWIKIVTWAMNGFDVILATSNYYTNIPGVFIGSNEEGSTDVKFFVYESDGKQYLTVVDLDDIVDGSNWVHVAMTWVKDGSITVYVNGAPIPTTTTTTDGSWTGVIYKRLITGITGTGAEFYLDDLKIFYDYLNPTEVADIAEVTTHLTTETIIPPTTTTTTTTTPPTTTTTTTTTTPTTTTTTTKKTTTTTTKKPTTTTTTTTKPKTTTTKHPATAPTCKPCVCDDTTTKLPEKVEKYTLSELEVILAATLGAILLVILAVALGVFIFLKCKQSNKKKTAPAAIYRPGEIQFGAPQELDNDEKTPLTENGGEIAAEEE